MLVRRLSLALLYLIFARSWPMQRFATNGALQEIVEGPLSVNVSVNHRTEFSCIASKNMISVQWRANGTLIQTIPGLQNEREMITNTTQKFDLEANINQRTAQQLNNTNISCVGIFRDPVSSRIHFAESDPALLLVQGILDAPTDLSVVPLNESCNLTWNPPFVLDGIDFHYLVTTTVFIESGPPLIRSNITLEPYFTVQTNNSSNCTLCEMCVQAVTDATFGEMECVNITLGVEVPQTIKEEDSQAALECGSVHLHHVLVFFFVSVAVLLTLGYLCKDRWMWWL